MAKRTPTFAPWPELQRPWEAWRPERWKAPEPKPPPELEVHEPPPVGPDELHDLLAEARQEGAAEARAEVQEELASLRATVEALGPAVEEIARLRHAQLMAAAEDVADIVRVFAHKLVGDSLALHPDALPKLVRDAISQLPDTEEVSIVCSPQAAEGLGRHLDAGLRDRVVVDGELGEGVIVRTRNASLDATLRHAESALEAAIQGWLSEQWWADGPL